MRRPVRTALAGDHPIIRAGLTSMLSGYPEIAMVERRRAGSAPIDVLLFDLPAQPQATSNHRFPLCTPATKKILFTFERDPAVIAAASRSGAQGYLFKGTEPEELASAIIAAHHGEFDNLPLRADSVRTDVGLTARETEVLTLITHGISNNEIAQRMFVSRNTVKSYIRSCYRKIGAETRSQAVIWALTSSTTPTDRPTTQSRLYPETSTDDALLTPQLSRSA